MEPPKMLLSTLTLILTLAVMLGCAQGQTHNTYNAPQPNQPGGPQYPPSQPHPNNYAPQQAQPQQTPNQYHAPQNPAQPNHGAQPQYPNPQPPQHIAPHPNPSHPPNHAPAQFAPHPTGNTPAKPDVLEDLLRAFDDALFKGMKETYELFGPRFNMTVLSTLSTCGCDATHAVTPDPAPAAK